MNQIVRAWSFLTLFSITLIVLGHRWGGRDGLLLALIVVLATNSFIYFYEDRRILKRFGGHLVEGQDPYGLNEMVRRLSVKARIAVPSLVVLNDTAPQAGALGRNIGNGVLILTEGVIKKLTHAELEAVIAYQIASIRNLNTLAFAVGSFMASFCFLISESLDFCVRVLIVEKKNRQSPVTQIFTRLLSPLIGMILRVSVRPSFYLAADHLATQLLGDPKHLATAIWKLGSYADTRPFHSPLSSAHIFIVSPLREMRWTRLVATHPPIATRVRQLIGYYPV